MSKKDKLYFASDFHLGFPDPTSSLLREKQIVAWLDSIKHNAKAVFLLGDIFDFWWEWKKVVPRGFTRFIAKLAELTDLNIPVHFFTGNHDIWVFDYLPKETGIILHRKPYVHTEGKTKFYMAHGDGLGSGDKKFKLLKKLFTNRFLQKSFSLLHPNIAIRIAQKWSYKSRMSHREPQFLGKDKEWLFQYSEEMLKKEHFDFFIYGHRHVLHQCPINSNTQFVYLGEWISKNSYGVFAKGEFSLKIYKTN